VQTGLLGPAGAFAQEYTVTHNAFSDNELYGRGKANHCGLFATYYTIK
jgi:hypothetical protein